MQLKGLENNKKKICMFLDFGFEVLKKEKKKYVIVRGKEWQWNKLK